MREGVRLLAQYSDDVVLAEIDDVTFDAFFSNPVWKVLKLGLARSIHTAYSVMENMGSSVEAWRVAQGVVSAAAPLLESEDRVRNALKTYRERLQYRGRNPAYANSQEEQREEIDELFRQVADVSE
jgi:hypothetical protein